METCRDQILTDTELYLGRGSGFGLFIDWYRRRGIRLFISQTRRLMQQNYCNSFQGWSTFHSGWRVHSFPKIKSFFQTKLEIVNIFVGCELVNHFRKSRHHFQCVSEVKSISSKIHFKHSELIISTQSAIDKHQSLSTLQLVSKSRIGTLC